MLGTYMYLYLLRLRSGFVEESLIKTKMLPELTHIQT